MKSNDDDDGGNDDDYDDTNVNYVVMIILMTKYLLRQFCAEILVDRTIFKINSSFPSFVKAQKGPQSSIAVSKCHRNTQKSRSHKLKLIEQTLVSLADFWLENSLNLSSKLD